MNSILIGLMVQNLLNSVGNRDACTASGGVYEEWLAILVGWNGHNGFATDNWL